MTRPNVQSWDPAATNNTDVGGIGLAENIMRPPAVNNALRELMAEVAKFYDDLGGVNTVAGTGDAITVTTASGLTALATGLVLSFRAGANNTTNVTINVDGLGAKAIRKVTSGEVALIAGDLVAGGKYLLVYDAAANGAAGAWILLNAASSVFSDAAFRVQDNGDATKQLAFEVSGLTSGTTRTLTAPDKSGTIALTSSFVGNGYPGGFRTLKVTVTGATTATITADGMTLLDSSGNAAYISAVNLTNTNSANGVGGLDTGAIATSTWYNLFVIYNPTAQTTATLLSLSASAPTMPSGYTHMLRVGALRNASSGGYWRTIQYGRRTQITIGTNPPSLPAIGNNANSPVTPTWAALAVASFVPPTASEIILNLYFVSGGAMAAPNNSYGGLAAFTNAGPLAGQSSSTGQSIQGSFVLEGANIYYAGGSTNNNLLVMGWSDNL